MSLDKAIKHGKEHRKPYRDCRSFDLSCRNHGAGHAHPCPWCEANRLYNARKKEVLAEEQIAETRKDGYVE